MDDYRIINLRDKLIIELKNANGPIKIDYFFPKKELRDISIEDIIFYKTGSIKKLRRELLNDDLYKKIDYKNINFSGVYLPSIGDFTEMINLKINPQTVANRNLSNCVFDKGTIIGELDGCIIDGMEIVGQTKHR